MSSMNCLSDKVEELSGDRGSETRSCSDRLKNRAIFMVVDIVG